MMAKYDVAQSAGRSSGWSAGGAQLRPFPPPVMDACYKAANEIYAETLADQSGLQEGL